jgi:hypothetical protein
VAAKDGGTVTRAVETAIERANTAAGPVMAANFTHPAWRMDAAMFERWWGGTRLASVATAGSTASPHAAPVEVTLRDGVFVVPTFVDSVRMADMRRNPNIVLTAWDDPWHAAIVYGRAAVPEGANGNVPVAVRPTRIYAIRAPAGHAGARQDA